MENSKQNDDFSLEQRRTGEELDSFLSANENVSMDETVIAESAESINTTFPDFNQAKTPPNEIEIKPKMDVNTPVTYITNLLKRMKIFSPANSPLVQQHVDSLTEENSNLDNSQTDTSLDEFVIKWTQNINHSMESLDTFHDTIPFPSETENSPQTPSNSTYFSGKSTNESTLENCLNHGKLDVLVDLSKEESLSNKSIEPIEKFHDAIPYLDSIAMHSTVLIDNNLSQIGHEISEKPESFDSPIHSTKFYNSGQFEMSENFTQISKDNCDKMSSFSNEISASVDQVLNNAQIMETSLGTTQPLDNTPKVVNIFERSALENVTPISHEDTTEKPNESIGLNDKSFGDNLQKNFNIFESTGIQNVDLLAKTFSESVIFENLTQIPKMVVAEDTSFGNFLNDGKLNVLADLTDDTTQAGVCEKSADFIGNGSSKEAPSAFLENFESISTVEDVHLEEMKKISLSTNIGELEVPENSKTILENSRELVVNLIQDKNVGLVEPKIEADNLRLNEVKEENLLEISNLNPTKMLNFPPNDVSIGHKIEIQLIEENFGQTKLLVEDAQNVAKNISSSTDQIEREHFDKVNVENVTQNNGAKEENLLEISNLNSTKTLNDSQNNAGLFMDHKFEVTLLEENITEILDFPPGVNEKNSLEISNVNATKIIGSQNFDSNEPISFDIQDVDLKTTDNKVDHQVPENFDEIHVEKPEYLPEKFHKNPEPIPNQNTQEILKIKHELSSNSADLNSTKILNPTEENLNNVLTSNTNQSNTTMNDLKKIQTLNLCNKENNQNIPNQKSLKTDSFLKDVKTIATSVVENVLDRVSLEMNNEEVEQEKSFTQIQFEMEELAAEIKTIPGPEILDDFKIPAPMIEDEQFNSAEEFLKTQTVPFSISQESTFKPRESVLLEFDPIMHCVVERNSTTSLSPFKSLPKVPERDNLVELPQKLEESSMQSVPEGSPKESKGTPKPLNRQLLTDNQIFNRISSLALSIKATNDPSEQERLVSQIEDEVQNLHKLHGTVPPKKRQKSPVKPFIVTEEMEKKMKIAEDLAMEAAALDRENTNYKQENQAIQDDVDGCRAAYSHYLSKYEKIKKEIFERKAHENDLKALLQERTVHLEKLKDDVELKRLFGELETVNKAIAKAEADGTAQVDLLKIRLRQAEIKYQRLESALEQKNKEWRELNEICDSLTKK